MKTVAFKWSALSKRQKMVLNWWTPASKYHDYDGIIADGSIRSGKTISMGFSYALWAMSMFDRQNFGMAGKTIESFRRNVLGNLKSQLRQRGYTVTERKSENLVVVAKGNKANSFYIFGGKDERSQDLIQGITLAGMFFDEVALMPESFVNQATARCSVDGSKFWFNCNPASPQHWFYVKWILKHKARNLVYLHFTMLDNLTLSKRIRERYEAQYTGVFYDRYIRGLWVIAEGIIYRCFSKDKHILEEIPETDGKSVISADYGIQNANVFLLWQKERYSERWDAVDEERWSGREEQYEKSVKELVDGLDEMLERNELDKSDIKFCIVDPSASALKVELRQRGYKTRDANNDVLNGIQDVITLLLACLLGFSPKCEGTIKEFGLYSWDAKATERGEDRPIKTDDHGMDAVRYFVRTMNLAKNRNKKQSDHFNIYS